MKNRKRLIEQAEELREFIGRVKEGMAAREEPKSWKMVK